MSMLAGRPGPDGIVAFGGVLLAVLAVACSTEGGPEEGGTVFTDSAGVVVAEALAPAWGPSDGWRIAPEPEFEIGGVRDDPLHLLADVVGAVRLSDGRIVVADRGSSELRFFSPRGQGLLRVGGEGEGPGEFRSLDFVDRLPGDSLLAYDGRLRRVQVFGPQGGFIRSLRVQEEGGVPAEGPWVVADKAVGVSGAGDLLLRFLDFGDSVPSGIVRWPRERLVEVDLVDGTRTVVMDVPGHEASVEVRPGGGYSHGEYLFARGPMWAVGGGVLAFGDTERWSMSLRRLGGSQPRLVRRAVPTHETSEADQRAWIEARLDLVFPGGGDPEQVSGFRQRLMRVPFGATFPAFRSLELDAEGHLWVEPWFALGTTPPSYEVFASDGRWLGALGLPPGLDRGYVPYQAPELEIGSDYVLGVWKDELDVAFVRLYRLGRGGG